MIMETLNEILDHTSVVVPVIAFFIYLIYENRKKQKESETAAEHWARKMEGSLKVFNRAEIKNKVEADVLRGKFELLAKASRAGQFVGQKSIALGANSVSIGQSSTVLPLPASSCPIPSEIFNFPIGRDLLFDNSLPPLPSPECLEEVKSGRFADRIKK